MRSCVLAAIALLSVPSLAETSKWDFDSENSSAEFVCKHVMVTNVRGMMHKVSGSVVLDETTPASSKVNATLDVSTISTGVEERDTHLKSPDFFDVAKFPQITFVSTTVTKASATSYSVTGNLTMHGITKPVTLAVTVSAPFKHAGGMRRAFEATTSVNRKDFGLTWEYPAEGAGIVVGNTVKISLDVEAVQAPVVKGK
jgi:polyisoprenoid-binding protein YceI